MPAALVLNELSYGFWMPTEALAAQKIRLLAESVKDAKAINREVYILSKVRLPDLVFGNGLPLRRFLGDSATKDHMLTLFALANRSPFSIEACDVGGYECSRDGQNAEALLYCVMLPGVALSFGSAEEWDDDLIEVRVLQALEGDDEVIVEESVRSVPNASNLNHIAVHKKLLAAPAVEWLDGDHLWNARTATFPRLIFLDRVEGQIRGMSNGSEQLRQVAYRLQELQESVDEWNLVASAFPAWKSHVTGEGDTRKRLAMFSDSNGIEHCYDLHARFTPGAGRVHFRLLRDAQQIEIAHVGEKL